MDNKETTQTEKKYRKNAIICAIVVGAAILSAAAAVIVNRPQRDDVIVLKPAVQTSETERTTKSTHKSTKTSRTTKVTTTRVKKSTTTASKTQKPEPETQAEIAYSFPADINTADRDMLMAVNGIGEVTADRVLDYRDSVGVIYNMDMLLEVNGIGDGTLGLLKEYFYVDEADYRDMPEDNDEGENCDNNYNDYEQTQTSKAETTARQTTTRQRRTTTVRTTTTTIPKERQPVNINAADWEEIADKLLLDEDRAKEIVAVREQIEYYSSPNELLLCSGFSEKLVAELWDYILLE